MKELLLLLFAFLLPVFLQSGMIKNERNAVKEQVTKATDESIEEGETDMEKNTAIIMNATQIDLDCAQGAWERLQNVGCSDISKAELLPSKIGYSVKITDVEGNLFYIGLGDMGYLEVIYKDTLEGEPVFYVD